MDTGLDRAGLKPIGLIAPNWAPRPILQTLVQVDWEPGPTEIVPKWAPHLPRPTQGLAIFFVNFNYITFKHGMVIHIATSVTGAGNLIIDRQFYDTLRQDEWLAFFITLHV